MTTSVLICDDSGFARKQMVRSIPSDWDVEINYAENGDQAMALIEQGKAEVMFLDLNMPTCDGYQTMRLIKERDLPTVVIVVSGDVQPEAKARALKMGALDFICKPVDKNKLGETLNQFGIYTGDASKVSAPDLATTPEKHFDKLDAYREMAIVAMGQASDRLAQLLGAFITLPIPNVNEIASTELHMAIAEIHEKDSVSAISQGFVSSGINGEALLIFNDANFERMAKLLKYGRGKLDAGRELEALMDISNILIGACLNALAIQLNVRFGQCHPTVLGRHCDLKGLLNSNVSRWKKVVAIEMACSIGDDEVCFDLMLLFPAAAMEIIFSKLMNLLE